MASGSQTKPSRRTLQRAKRSLKETYGDCEWFCGVGIVPTDDGLGLRLNVDPQVAVTEGEIPETYRNIAIEIVPIKDYQPRNQA